MTFFFFFFAGHVLIALIFRLEGAAVVITGFCGMVLPCCGFWM